MLRGGIYYSKFRCFSLECGDSGGLRNCFYCRNVFLLPFFLCFSFPVYVDADTCGIRTRRIIEVENKKQTKIKTFKQKKPKHSSRRANARPDTHKFIRFWKYTETAINFLFMADCES